MHHLYMSAHTVSQGVNFPRELHDNTHCESLLHSCSLLSVLVNSNNKKKLNRQIQFPKNTSFVIIHSPSCHFKPVVSSVENKWIYWTTFNKPHMSFSTPSFLSLFFPPIISISLQEPEENTSVTSFSYSSMNASEVVSSVISLCGFTQAWDAAGFTPTVDVGFMLITSVCARLKRYTFLSSL